MNAQVIDLAAARRRRDPLGTTTRRCAPRVSAPSIEIGRGQLAALASPRSLHQLAMMLDDVEYEFTPRASLIERLRFTHGVDEFVDVVRITLERAQ